MPEPTQPSNVPYQAYRSKRHSRNFSNSRLTPNVSPPPSVAGTPTKFDYDQDLTEKEANGSTFTFPAPPDSPQSPTAPIVIVEPTPTPAAPAPVEKDIPDVPSKSPSPSQSSNGMHEANGAPNESSLEQGPLPALIASAPHSEPATSSFPSMSSEPVASGSQTPQRTIRKVSTFRRIPRNSRPTQPSPLNPQSHSRTNSASSAQLPSKHAAHDQRPVSMLAPTPVSATPSALTDRTTSRSSIIDFSLPSPAIADPPRSPNNRQTHPLPSQPQSPNHISPPTRTTSLQPTPSTSPAPIPPSTSISPVRGSSSSRAPSATRAGSAPYRPGFQPKGVYRPRTDEFLVLRRAARDTGRVERTKLARRLEKLVRLHFPTPQEQAVREKEKTSVKRQSLIMGMGRARQRTSSLFDLGEWKEWRDSWASGGKDEVRAAEQRITPWQEDSEVGNCPLCSASFHPLTNRKHHCRLCGKIICALPTKKPHRPDPCSVLFVVDPKTRKIEEVGEGVDYGVRKRTASNASPAKGPGNAAVEEVPEEEKFLKGVRICRECRPVLMREQYQQEMSVVPTFTRLYEAFEILEKEIEDLLPQFQELLLGVSTDEQLTKEATAARKRLLDVFAQYDALAKRIRTLPCKPGSSQERVQAAVVTRANLFLEKNMFPLQSIPKSKIKTKSKEKDASRPDEEDGALELDIDSELAHQLQPLLEQEALLESFVEEAKRARKFEDVKTLKENLNEIRREIERIVAEGERKEPKGKRSKR